METVHDCVTGRATIFGLNWDGSIDKEDNGHGAFGQNTRDHSLVGVSLPIPVVKGTIGDYKDHHVRQQITSGEYKVRVVAKHTNMEIVAPIVDVGPAVWTGNAIDLTYGATRKLGLRDNSTVTYWIMKDGQNVPIHGWNPR